MPLKPDLSYKGLDKFVVKPVVENKSSEEETNAVRKNTDAPIIKEWVLDDEEENVTRPKIVKKIVRPSIIKKEFVKPRQQEKIAMKTVKKFWSTAMAKTINGEAQIHAWVDGKEIIITKSSVRRDLRLADKEGVDCLPNCTIYENLELMSVPTESVADEAVYKELDDRLVRASTIASSLETKHDNGNIDKSQSKAIPNEASSLGTTLGGGPRCQDTIGDTIAQTRFENVYKLSNDSLLVLDLEKTKTTQALKITSLKWRVKKLEKKQRLRTHKLKILYKVFVEKEVADKEVNNEVQKVIKEVVEDTNTAKLIVDVAHVSAAGKVNAASIAVTKSQDKGKAIMIEEPVKPKKKDQIRLDEEVALKL
nr:hypothetical protein [Tanacetum cinerariifolium]